MSTRQAPIPFDADSIGGAYITVHAAPAEPLMLSQVIDQGDWHMPEAEAGPGTARPLDKHAKWRLSELAERAYELLKSRGLVDGETLEGYRRRIAVAACGKRISQACHGDRMTIQAAFLREMDRAAEASRALVKSKSTAKDIALHKLAELLKQRSYPPNYGEGIALRVCKVPLAQCSAKQVWFVFYSVNNNGNKRDGKGCEDNRWKKRKAQRQSSKSL